MKNSDILREVKKRALSQEDGYSFYICLGIRCAKAPLKKQVELMLWIQSLLSPYHSYGEWLGANHFYFYEQIKKRNWRANKINFNEGRLQWLDWMIQYWEERNE